MCTRKAPGTPAAISPCGSAVRRESAQRLERPSASDCLPRSHVRIGAEWPIRSLVAYVDGERRFRFANSTYREWLGLDPEEIVGRLTHEVLDADYFAAIEPYVQRVLNGERVEYEVHDSPAGVPG
ncbi:PAS domain-containing protein [Paraburkholderia phytofirmans]|uniref:PAS domain-containing protein n=1 Tax=Paraburkholderia phytofirmans TaxID=261302 RepID=UPI001F40AAA8|nr:PAS domain-containing protein [Paraburkholderia phytofirmans]